jgi:hypothetical protein
VAGNGPALARPLTLSEREHDPPPMTGNETTNATRMTCRVAFVTCGELPALDPDDRLVIAPLAARGIEAEPAIWDDPGVDWARYDLAVLRSAWDYPPRRDAFVEWAHAVPRLANPAPVISWNTDKSYLAALASAGVPVVPTEWLPPGTPWTPRAEAGEVVLKPSISAGSKDTGRYDLADPLHRRLAAELVERLHEAGRSVMLQPYLPAVDTRGETALLYFGGRYSHAIRKGPLLTGPDLGFEGLYKEEQISARSATPAELAIAEAALAQVPGDPLYARVDLIPGPSGAPLVVELELAEPSLFLGYADGAAERFADAITSALRAARS